MTRDDRDLYERFAAVRREEETRVPEIPVVLPAAHVQAGRKFAWKPTAATACVAMTIAVAAWLHSGYRDQHKGPGREREQAAVSITTWKPATDFLLETPGRELLQGVPDIGEWHGAVNAPGSGERHRRLRKQVLP